MERQAEAGREPVSRLMITKMVLENFKSYAGEQEIGPFHKRFSSVVGPNGSGKSNVIDALLFVFGKRAKQLRLNKVSELIHKSSRFPDLEHARVSVYFQLILDNESSDDDYTVVPGSEFVVTRIAYQNNQSKYSVDGRNSSYTEVGQVLRNYGVDLDNNRFLILQGEVEQIAMMKPKAPSPHEEGLLEYLEDIIGSNKFVEQIEELGKAVDGLNEQRVDKINRLKIAEKEKDSLEVPMKDAQLYLEKECDIRTHQNILYQYYIHESNKNLSEGKAQSEGIKERLDYERNKLRETEAKLGEIDRVYVSTSAEYDRLAEEMQRTAEEFISYERRDTKMIEDLKHVKQQIVKAKAAIAKDAKKESDCLAEVDNCSRQLKTLTADIAAATTRKANEEAELEEIMKGLSEATSALREELEGVQARLADADRKVATLVTEKEGVEMSLQLQRSRSVAAQKSLASNQEKLEKLNLEKSDFISRQSGIRSEEQAARRTSQTSVSEIERLKGQEAEIQSEIRSAVSAVEEAKAAMQQGPSGRSEVIDYLMKATRKGGPLAASGIHGRLGDLGTIPPEYDLAVCLATGMLDAIVVDTAEAAQKCVSYVREKGRITCIVLREIGDFTSKMNSVPTGMPTQAQRLFDLITPLNDTVRPAFYTALRDTLVVRDLDTAVSVAYEGNRAKWRVITLDGNLIDQAGTMSGGGKPTKSGGGMGPPRAGAGMDAPEVTAAAVRELEEQVAKAQQRLQACRSALGDAEKKLKESKQKMKSCEIEMEKLELALNLINEQIADISSRMPSLQSECIITPSEQAEINSLEHRIGDINRRVAAASPDLAALQEQARALQQQIMDVGGPKLKRAQSKVDAAATTIETLMQALTSAEVGEGNAKKQASKAAAARLKSEKELQKAEEKQSELLAEQQEMEKEAEVVLVAQQQAKAAAEKHEEILKNITKEHVVLKELVNTIKNVEIDLTTSFDEFTKIIRENESKLSHWTTKLEAIRVVHLEETKEHNAIARSFTTPNTSVDPNAMEVVDDNARISEESPGNRSVLAAETSIWSMKDEELPVLSQEQLPSGRKIDELKRDISIMETERDALKSSVNLAAIDQYKEKLMVYKERMTELEGITAERDSARRVFDECRKQRLEMFMHGFGIITLKLKEMYQMITLGGDAELELVDSLDPFSEGIVFSVRPPKKSWKNISNLSGGEKTLSSLALVFALHHYKPTPLYVMDEIDAALDFKNVSIVANYIKERTKNAQFVIISLRNNMFELADRLVGIYKTNDATKSITINPKLFDAAVQGQRPKSVGTGALTKQTDSGVRTALADTTNIRA